MGFWIGRRVGLSLLDRLDRPRPNAGVVRAREGLDHLLPIVAAIVVVSLIPVARELRRARTRPR